MNTQTKNAPILGTMLMLAGTFGVTAGAHAGDAHGDALARHDDVVVRYADLNLATMEGTRTLYARLSAAAERACGNEPRKASLNQKIQYSACYESALNKAVTKIGHQQVRALHAARTEPSVG